MGMRPGEISRISDHIENDICSDIIIRAPTIWGCELLNMNMVIHPFVHNGI